MYVCPLSSLLSQMLQNILRRPKTASRYDCCCCCCSDFFRSIASSAASARMPTKTSWFPGAENKVSLENDTEYDWGNDNIFFEVHPNEEPSSSPSVRCENDWGKRQHFCFKSTRTKNRIVIIILSVLRSLPFYLRSKTLFLRGIAYSGHNRLWTPLLTVPPRHPHEPSPPCFAMLHLPIPRQP